MAHRHTKEENLFLNNSATSSSSDNSDEESSPERITKNADKTTPLSVFIHNDLKGMRKGGPLSENGAAKKQLPPPPPETRPCGAVCKRCPNKAETALYYPVKFKPCNKKKDHVFLCAECAFRRERCRFDGMGKVDDADRKYPESDKERYQAWP